MNLKEFVSVTIGQIIDAVQEIKAEKGNSRVNPKPRGGTLHSNLHQMGFIVSSANELIQQVEFDVALTVTEEKENKGGIGIFVAGVGIGGQRQSENSNSSVSRVKFKVPIALP